MLKAIRANKKITDQIIAEEFIQGREITVPILDDKALPISELIAELERNGNVKVNSPCDEDTPNFNDSNIIF